MIVAEDGSSDADGCADKNQSAEDGDEVEQQHRLSEKKDNK